MPDNQNPSNQNSTKTAGQISYQVKGSDMQFVEFTLAPNQFVVSETGTLMFMEQGVQMSTKLGDGSEKHKGFLGSIAGLTKRAIAGENYFMAFFTNNDTTSHRVAFAGNYPGKIQPVDLSDNGGSIYCQRGSFICGAGDVSISLGFSKKLGFGFFGGEGFVMQKLSGSGTAFIHACGAIEQIKLEKGQAVFIDTGSLVGFTQGLDFDIQIMRGVKNILFGGEDLFLTSVTAKEHGGYVWIQSLPYNRLVGALSAGVISVLAGKKG